MQPGASRPLNVGRADDAQAMYPVLIDGHGRRPGRIRAIRSRSNVSAGVERTEALRKCADVYVRRKGDSPHTHP